MIRSMLKKKWQQCSYPMDYVKEVHTLCQNLINVGCEPEDLKKLFIEASTKINTNTNDKHIMKKTSIKPHQWLFLYSVFYPKRISRQMIYRICKETCGPMLNDLLGMKKLTIACYRPTNLRDLLVPSKLIKCQNDLHSVDYHKQGTNLETKINNINHEEEWQQ